MLQIDKSKVVGEKNKNLVLETAGKIYIKQGSRYYELNYKSKPVTEAEAVSLAKQQISKIEPLDTSEFATKNDVRTLELNSVSKKDFEESKAVQNALNDVFANNGEFTDAITPATVQTMQIIVGSEQLQFDWIDNYNSVERVNGPLTINNETKEVTFKPGWIKHYTLGRPVSNDSVKPNDTAGYFKWYILNKDYKNEESTEKLQPGTYYYYLTIPVLVDNSVLDANAAEENSDTSFDYTKATLQVNYEPEDDALYPGEISEQLDNKGAATRTGVGYIDRYTSKLETYTVNSQTNYRFYNLLYSVVTVTESSITKSEMNGFTEITPGQIRAYLFTSGDGSSYLDLNKNVLKLGSDLLFEGGSLTLKGGVLAGLIAARDSDNNIAAGINGLDTYKTKDGKKVLMFAGTDNTSTDETNSILNSKTLIYDDGTIKTSKIEATGGTIGGFTVANNCLISGSERTGRLYLSSSLLHFSNTTNDVNTWIGNTTLPAIYGKDYVAAARIDIDQSTTGIWANIHTGFNAGLMSSVKGAGRENYAFYSNYGQFAGLRPKLRYVNENTELTTTDHTLIAWEENPKDYYIAITLPDEPEVGQYYEIIATQGSGIGITSNAHLTIGFVKGSAAVNKNPGDKKPFQRFEGIGITYCYFCEDTEGSRKWLLFFDNWT